MTTNTFQATRKDGDRARKCGLRRVINTEPNEVSKTIRSSTGRKDGRKDGSPLLVRGFLPRCVHGVSSGAIQRPGDCRVRRLDGGRGE